MFPIIYIGNNFRCQIKCEFFPFCKLVVVHCKHPKPVSSLRSADSSPKSQLIKNGEFMERVEATKQIKLGPCQNYRSIAGLGYQLTSVTPVKVDTAQLDRAADF